MAFLNLLVIIALLSGHRAHAAAPRRALLGRPADSSLTTSAPLYADTTSAKEINSITTLEHAVVADSKEARSQWVNAYVKPGVSNIRSAMQRIHKVLGLGQERVKGRMLQQRETFSAGGAGSGGARSAGTMEEPHVESVRPSGSSLTTTSQSESLRSVTPSDYQPLQQEPQPGTATADVANTGATAEPTTTPSNLQTTQTTPSGQATTENMRDVTPSQYGSINSNDNQGSVAHTDVVGPATVIPDVRTTPSITGTTEMSAMRGVTPSGYNTANQAGTPGSLARVDVVGQPTVVHTPPTSSGAASENEASGG